MKVFISQASRNDAHNLDDLRERWEMKKVVHEYKEMKSIEIPEKIPAFSNYNDMLRYKADLAIIMANWHTERESASRTRRNEIGIALKQIESLFTQLKAAFAKPSPDNAELNQKEKAQYRMAKYLIQNQLINFVWSEDGIGLQVQGNEYFFEIKREGE